MVITKKEDSMFKSRYYKKICLFLAITFFMNFSGITVLATESVPSMQEQMIGTDDVRVIIGSIQDTIKAGEVPDVGTLVLLDAIKDKVASQVQDAEYVDAESLLKIDTLLAKISDVITIPIMEITVEQLAVIIQMLDESDEMMHGDVIVHTKPELSKRVVKEERVFIPRDNKPIGAPVCDADYAETSEIQFTPRITELAASLNNDPVEMFTWVRNNIVPEMYYGSSKGAEETLLDKAGSPADISSLMISMFRVSEYPARYVYGDVKLKIDDLMNWTGVPEDGDPQAAINILKTNGIPTEVLIKKGTVDTIEGAIFYHTWVAVKDGNVWRLVDPSYKHFTFIKGSTLESTQVAMLEGLGEQVATSLVDSIGEKEILADLSVLEEAVESAKNVMEGYEVGSRVITVSEKNNLPPYLAQGIIGARKPAGEYAELPDDQRFKVRISFPGDGQEPYVVNMSEVASKKISLTYEMLGYAPDVTIFDVSPMVTYMVPNVSIDNEIVYTRSGTVRLASRFAFQTAILKAGSETWEPQNRTETAGTSTDVYICVQNTSVDYLKEKVAEFQAIVDSSELGPEADGTQEMISNQLYATNRLYFAMMDMFHGLVSQELGIVNVNHINVSFLTDDIKVIRFWFWVIGVAKGGATIDIVRSCSNPEAIYSQSNDPAVMKDAVKWMLIAGSFGTNMEHAVLELVYDIPAVSTGKIFGEAMKAGVPLIRITHADLEADLARVSANSTVKNHIRSSLTTDDYEALIPQTSVTLVNPNTGSSWTGAGWTVRHIPTGGCGYMICGGLHNSQLTLANGGSIAGAIDNKMSQIIHLLHTIEAAAEIGIIPAAGALIAAVGLSMGAMALLANTTMQLAAICSFFSFMFAFLALAFILVTLTYYISYLQAVIDSWQGCLRRWRKKFEFDNHIFGYGEYAYA